MRRYPALPQPRQLSAYDPEWEEDADYVERAQQTLREQAATQKLPRPAVLKDILTELTERQAQEQQQAEAEALAAAEAAGPSRELRGASTSVSFEGMADAVRTIINEDIDDARRTRGLTASMAGVQPEPDLARVNAGTGCGLQLDSVWCAPFFLSVTPGGIFRRYFPAPESSPCWSRQGGKIGDERRRRQGRPVRRAAARHHGRLSAGPSLPPSRFTNHKLEKGCFLYSHE